MAFTIGSGTFTNGSATVTGVTLTSGTLAYFASGTRMVVGVNPVIQEVEAIAAPTVSTITLRSAWTGTGGTYSFLANQTSEGLRDAVQAIRTNNVSLQSFIDSIDTAATANSVAQRDASGQLTATNLITADKIIHDGDTNTAIRFPAADTVTVETDGVERLRVDSSGNVGVGTASPASRLHINGAENASGGITLTAGAQAHKWFLSSDFVNVHNIETSSGAAAHTWQVNGTERMRIDSSGNVGINTSTANLSSSTRALTVAGGSEPSIELQGVRTSDGNVAGLRFFNGANQNAAIISTRQGSDNSGGMIFGTASSGTLAERMRIDSSGNVLIGTTSTINVGASTADGVVIENRPTFGGAIVASSTSDGAAFLRRNGSDGGLVGLYKGTSLVGTISVTGSSTAYNTSSDYRLKEDWQPMDCACDRVMRLNPVNFAWKANGKRVDGFLAHELQEVVPEAVTGKKDETRIEEYEVEPAVYEDVVIPAELDDEGNEISPERTEQKLVKEAVMGEREVPEYQGIDQSKLTPLLTAALQDAIKKIEALEARIEALEG